MAIKSLLQQQRVGYDETDTFRSLNGLGKKPKFVNFVLLQHLAASLGCHAPKPNKLDSSQSLGSRSFEKCALVPRETQLELDIFFSPKSNGMLAMSS